MRFSNLACAGGPECLESRGQPECAHWPSNAPPTDRSCRQRGLHWKIRHLAPPSDALWNEGASKQADGDERGATGRNG